MKSYKGRLVSAKKMDGDQERIKKEKEQRNKDAQDVNTKIQEFAKYLLPEIESRHKKRLNEILKQPLVWTPDELQEFPSLEEKVYLMVTGTSPRGINYSLGNIFSQLGAKVLLVGSSDKNIESLRSQELGEFADDIFQMDPSSRKEVEEKRDWVHETYGGIDGIFFSRAYINPVNFLTRMLNEPISKKDKEDSLAITIGGLKNIHEILGPLLDHRDGFLGLFDYAFREDNGYKILFMKKAQEKYAKKIAKKTGRNVHYQFLPSYLSDKTKSMSALFYHANEMMKIFGMEVKREEIVEINTKKIFLESARMFLENKGPGFVYDDAWGLREKYDKYNSLPQRVYRWLQSRSLFPEHRQAH